ncbi:hypothetical protein CF319_g717 [Tilletia indica]|nr:hypothetical protein CF319_g717 [Tilletia indica]
MTDPNFPATGLQIRPSNAAVQSDEAGAWDVVDSAEDIKSFGIAGRVWEAAYAARRYFREAAEPSHLDLDPITSLFSEDVGGPITILELGAGAGYGGLHLCKCLELHAQRRRKEQGEGGPKVASVQGGKDVRPRVLLTDLPNVLPLLDRNIAQAQASDKTLADHVDVQAWPCAWGDEEQAQDILRYLSTSTPTPVLTHLLAADLVYFPELFPPLLRSLLWLTEPVNLEDSTPATPEVIFTYKVRSLVKEQPFWAAFGSWFQFEAVICRRKFDPSQKEQDEESEWRRFGERRSDVALAIMPTSEKQDDEDEDSDQQVYVFLARRRPCTFGWTAPKDDQALMYGRRERREATTGEVLVATELDDTFEMLLLNSIGL